MDQRNSNNQQIRPADRLRMKSRQAAKKRAQKRARLRLACVVLLIFVLIGAVALIRSTLSKSDIAVPETLPAFAPADTISPLSDYPAFAGDALYLSSKKVLLVNLTTGKVLCEKDAGQTCKIASLTKIMTAIIAIENISDLDAEYTLTSDVISYLTSEGAAVAGFEAGETVTARDLLYAAMLPSGGDGAMGLADLVAGSQEAFVDMMNAKAAELGMRHTVFSNATGFDTEDNYSCALDVSFMFEYALKNELFREVISTSDYTTTATPQHPEGIRLHSTVFNGYSSNNLDMGCVIGGKTGFTYDAGLCLATYAKKDGNEYILVTLGAGNGSNKPQYNFYDSVEIYSAFVD